MGTPEFHQKNDSGHLLRVLTFWPLLFYGLGVIIGAGIYVALGEVITRAGPAAPLSFLVAGLCAALTGVCYAELAGRYPEAAGAAAYVKKAFSSDVLGLAVGLATTIAAALSAAAIAHGAVSYVDELLPFSSIIAVAALVICFGVLSAYGVKASVGIAAILGGLELLGLIASFGMGLYRAEMFELTPWVTSAKQDWSGIAAGAFVAFFAYVGFETLANMAEEVREPEKTVPKAIVVAVACSLVIYAAVSFSAVIGGAVGDSPLASLFKGHWAIAFSIGVFFTIANGTLVQINMLSRLFYGMAHLGELHRAFAKINKKTGTPIVAIVVATLIILLASILLNFKSLLAIVNFLTLAIFIAVDLALMKLQHSEPKKEGFRAPRWVPLAAVVLSIVMVIAELNSWSHLF